MGNELLRSLSRYFARSFFLRYNTAIDHFKRVLHVKINSDIFMLKLNNRKYFISDHFWQI